MDTLSLYDIKTEFIKLMGAIEEQGGEITPEQEEALAINESNYIEKAGNYGKYILYLQKYQEAADAEIQRIEGLKAKAQKTIDDMKERLAGAVEVYGKEKLKEVLSVEIKARKSDSVVITDESQIPNEFFNTVIKEVTTVSKTDIKKAIKEGREVAGAYLEEHINITIQ